MKIQRGIYIILTLLVLFSLSAASAADDLTDDIISADENEELILDETVIDDVSNANDNYDEELIKANDEKFVYAGNDSDELREDPGTYSGLSSEIGAGGNIVLTHDYYTYDSGDTIIISISNSVIDGNGAIIDMAGSTIRAFKVTASGVTIKNLTIKNANVTTDDLGNTDDEGAAIDFEKSGTIEYCNFINNSANAAGAVYFYKDNSKAINCNFSYNQAVYSGGAVCFEESGTIENCTFVNNTAVYDILGGGGAVCFNGTGNAINCNFTNNTAQGYFSWAGAICFNTNGNAINCTFTNNKAHDSGGAIEIYGNGKLENCSFDKNSANDGGAVKIYGATKISNCNFTENKAAELSGDGGAIYWNASAGKLENCSFAKNSAFHGGAVSFEEDGEVTNCNFTDNLAGDSGAIWFTADGTVENSTFIKNEAWDEYGGGIVFYTSGDVRNCNFTDNEADKQGGAVYFNGAGTVENSNFTNNKAQDGGAIFFSEDSTVKNCIFVKNCATDIRSDRYFERCKYVFYKNGEVTNSSFTENNATEGGAILFKGNGKATDCNFTNNSAKFGGAIDFESHATVENSSFNGNKASSNGSAIWMNRAGGIVSSSVFVNNRANTGTIFFRNDNSTSHLTINDNIFLNNNGVAIYFDKNDSDSNTDYNWFGNNATNYDIAPVANNAEINTWLFLNTTVNPDMISILDSLDIAFKLYAYTPSEVSEYDNIRLKAVDLTLTPTNGIFNTTKTELGKTVQYIPESDGIGTLTASIENASYTTTLKITDGTTFFDLDYIINANNNNTIVLDRDYTYNSTFDYNFTDGIVIDRPVTIIGNGHTINAAEMVRIFHIQADNVKIKNITFTNAISNGYGGAIYWQGANANLSSCLFENNSAVMAGAVAFYGSTGSIVSDCSFMNNSANNGGAIMWQVSDDSVVSDCSFMNNSAIQGGAIYWSSNDGVVSDCSFVNNSAVRNGGAIYWEKNNGNVSGCIFVNNSADNGAIYFNNQNFGQNLTINHNIFLNNDAVAIYFVRNDSASNADYNWFGNNATNCDIAPTSNNMEMNTWLFLNATSEPEGISILDSCDIIFKLYAYAPSGVSEYDSSRLKEINLTVTPTNGRINTTQAKLGEKVHYTPESAECMLTASIENAFYTTRLKISDGTTFRDLNNLINRNDNDTIILDNDFIYNSLFDSKFKNGININRPLTIVGNNYTIDATGMARIFRIQADDVEINNITFANAKIDGNGGAIYWYSGARGIVSDCSFVNNSAKMYGAAIYWNGANGNVSDCSFVNSTVTDEHGGAIYWHGANGVVSDCSFVNNSAKKYGGAIFWNAANGVVSDCIFVNNSAKSYDGGAIVWNEGLNGAISDCSFVNNSANDGGAILWNEAAGGTVSNCSFVNNSANKSGAAIYWDSGARGVVSDCSFVNNSANRSGALYWFANDGVVSASIFVNNSGDNGVLYFNNTNKRNLSINDNIFLNNDVVAIYFVNSDSTSNADYNWFGNNASNFDTEPLTTNVEISTWLFLNATADPNPVEILNSSDISFKLYSYNATGISDYDNSQLQPVNLTLTATKGDVDSIAKLGETVIYNPTSLGTGSVTAKVENVAYSIEINNIKSNPNLSVESDELTYGNNIAIALNYESAATGKVNITLKGKKSDYTFADLDLNETISLGILAADEYEVIVEYSRDEIYTNASARGTLKVNKANSTLTVSDIEFDYKDMGSGEISFTNATGVEAKVINHDEAIVFVRGNTITVLNLSADSYILEVTTITDENHNEVSKNATITVRKVNSTINVNDIVLYYGESINLAVTTDGAIGISADIDGENVELNENIVTIPDDLESGNHTLTITTVPNDNHKEASKTVNIVDCRIGNITVVVDGVEYSIPAVNGTAITTNMPEEIEKLKENITDLTGQLEEAQTNATNLANNLTIANQIVDKLIAQLEEAQANATQTINDLTHQLNEAQTNATKIANDQTNANQIVDNLTGQLNDAQTNATKIANDLENANQIVDDLTRQLEEAQANNDQTINDLTHQLEEAKVNATKIANDLENANQTVDNLTTQLEEAKVNATKIANDLENANQIVDNLTDQLEEALANATKIETVVVDGKEYPIEYVNGTATVTTNSTGPQNITHERKATQIIYKDMETTAIDTKVDGRIGKYFNVILKDSEGNILANKPIQIGFNGKVYNRTTDENGSAKLQINLIKADIYTFAICYLGDDDYNGSFVVSKITVKAQKGTLTVPNKSYKATTKTKTLSATFKAASGKVLANKKVSFVVNGKTYSAKTNAKGVATVNVSLNKKGTYSFVAKFAGDNTYAAVSKKAKLTIK
ncbi:adhesin-like protein [Methanobrevibacter ruminantium M1]|uniref:Adhesin-like protein n=1 Tax=Methanobrevibacter ruminantium (strain ATCC 35063 / DSM 1093 / JCM 13430 / OCM 146 / M1) TaxID=634498 RepID=D3E014_METRM|nr:right-handed parallel beta-helix repeat-containing protein [Methanobrevibacter ruminantium]ADC46190.1 adhesin-like protein [Methanobrevibacter ruminantium M1]